MKNIHFDLIIILSLIIAILGGLSFTSLLSLSSKEAEVTEKKLPKEEMSFEERIEKLDNYQKIAEYLDKYYIFEAKYDGVCTPKEFFNKKSGNAQDFALFTAQVFRVHDSISYVLKYRYGTEGNYKVNSGAVLRRGEKPRYLYADQEGAHLVDYGYSFENLFQKEEKRLGIEIKEYALLYPAPEDLTPDKWTTR